MTAQTADIQSQSPETLIAFLKLLLVGMLKKLPIKLLIAGGIALLAWIIHTYLLVVTNEGFSGGNSIWLDRILALQGRSISGTLVWTLTAGLVTSTIARILAYGFGNTVRGVIDTPKYLWQWANELGILAIPFLLVGYFLTILFGFFFTNGLLIVQLLLIVMGILIARHTSILLTVLRLGFSDAQRLAKRENLIPFNLAWPGMYFVGVLIGLVAILPSGLFAWVCGCLGFLLLILISIGLFIRSQGGTERVLGKKLLFWILPPAFLMLFLAAAPVFADDGGWVESGGTFSSWIGSPGAFRAIAMGFLPAAGSGMGVLFGTALGSMISIVGATGISAAPLAGRVSTTTSPPGSKTSSPPSRTAEHQAERFEQQQMEAYQFQEKGEPGELAARHRPGETAEDAPDLQSERAAYESRSRSAEGATKPGTGQRDIRGVEPTPPSTAQTGPGTGSAADSADRVAGFDQDRPGGQLAQRHRPETPESGGSPAERHRPGGIDEASEASDPAAIERPGARAERHRPKGGPPAERHRPGGMDEASDPAAIERPGTRAERHRPEAGPTAERHRPGGMDEASDPAAIERPGTRAERHRPEAGPPAERHWPGGIAEAGERPAALEKSGLRAERQPPEAEGGPLASRHDPKATAVDEPGPLHSRHRATQEPGLPIPPVPVPGYALDWELVVVRTPTGSGVTVQQRIELKERTRIGRHGAIDLKLLDPKVSRQHADIEIQGTTCRLTDLNSSNGTFVNGRRLTEPHDLKHGDAIKIGDTYFVVEQRPK